MRGVETRIQEIRHRVFREVARMAYHTEWPVDKRIEALPYKIIPGEVGNFRNDVFLERAIVGEKIILATGAKELPAFAALDNPYMAARGADLRDISNRVIRLLLGQKTPDPLGNRPAILVSDELLPSEVMALDRKKLLGLVTWHGSTDSHTTMLLRLMNIPGLAQTDIGQEWDGHQALLDGSAQSLYLDPDKQLVVDMGFGPSKNTKRSSIILPAQ